MTKGSPLYSNQAVDQMHCNLLDVVSAVNLEVLFFVEELLSYSDSYNDSDNRQVERTLYNQAINDFLYSLKKL